MYRIGCERQLADEDDDAFEGPDGFPMRLARGRDTRDDTGLL